MLQTTPTPHAFAFDPIVPHQFHHQSLSSDTSIATPLTPPSSANLQHSHSIPIYFVHATGPAVVLTDNVRAQHQSFLFMPSSQSLWFLPDSQLLVLHFWKQSWFSTPKAFAIVFILEPCPSLLKQAEMPTAPPLRKMQLQIQKSKETK